jgi:hypothetical protein
VPKVAFLLELCSCAAVEAVYACAAACRSSTTDLFEFSDGGDDEQRRRRRRGGRSAGWPVAPGARRPRADSK